MTKYPFFLFITIFLGCSPGGVEKEIQKEEQEPSNAVENPFSEAVVENTSEKISFEQYITQIPELSVGFSAGCAGSPGIIELPDNSYTPEGAQVIGRMKSIQNTHFIIYAYPADVQIPVLEVYNHHGKQVYEQPLLELGICANIEPGFNGTSTFTIISEKAIELKNVTHLSEYNSVAKIDTLFLEELLELTNQ